MFFVQLIILKFENKTVQLYFYFFIYLSFKNNDGWLNFKVFSKLHSFHFSSSMKLSAVCIILDFSAYSCLKVLNVCRNIKCLIWNKSFKVLIVY